MPELHDFVYPRAETWAAIASRHPLAALLAVVLAPNVFFAILNIAFVDHYVSGGFYREAPPRWVVKIGYFNFQELVVNTFVFPFGSWIVVRLAWPIALALRLAQDAQFGRQPPSPGIAERQGAWQCAEHLGYYVWFVALGCWIGTGIAFPTWNWLAKWYYVSEPLPSRNFATFFMTQLTFGTMASALSVLGLNFVLIRWLLPLLVRDDPIPSATYLAPITQQAQRMVHWLAFLPQFSLLAVALLIADRNPALLVMLGLISGLCYSCGILYARATRVAEHRLRRLLTAHSTHQ